jgi:hypothetical protein
MKETMCKISIHLIVAECLKLLSLMIFQFGGQAFPSGRHCSKRISYEKVF